MSEKQYKTDSGIEIKEVYTGPVQMDELPGKYPFTRGVHPTMYRDKLWTMRQYAGFSTAEESNKRYHFLLNQGVMGLSVAFDLPTQIGYDSDSDMAEGEVGKVGVAACISISPVMYSENYPFLVLSFADCKLNSFRRVI